VTILQQQSQNTGVCFVCSNQITNNQSILSPASAGPISQDETTSGLYIIPFLQNIQAFPRSRLQGSQQASQPKPTERTSSPLTTGERAQDNSTAGNNNRQHDTGSSGLGCAVPTVLHLTPRSGTLPNPNQSAARYSMYETNSYGQTTV
jgi:hypothetical protein